MESNALLQNFTSWLNKSGATLSDDVVVAVDNAQRPLSYPGWSIYTKTAFTEQQLICRLPKHCVLR